MKWLCKESFDIVDPAEITHYSVVNQDDILEVLAREAPIVSRIISL